MTIDLDLIPQGLWTDASPSKAVPPGALKTADNVVIDRNGSIEPRPGFPTDMGVNDGAEAGSSLVEKIVPYDGDLFYFLSSNKILNEDGTEILSDKDGTSGVAHESARVHSAELGGALYVTTSIGVIRLDAAGATTLALSGVPVGTQGLVSAVSTGTPLPLPTSNQWAYRVVFARRENNRIKLGAPSGRFRYRNASLADRATSIRVPLAVHDGSTYQYHKAEAVRAGDYVQIYRSRASSYIRIVTGLFTEETFEDVIPNDELFLVGEAIITSSDITAGYLDFSDRVGDDDLGVALYTNAGQQGALAANYRPPFARDVHAYSDLLFFGNTKQWPRRELSLNYDGGIDLVTVTGDFASGSPTVSNVSVTPETAWIGRYITDSANGPSAAGTNVPALTTITAVNPGSNEITMSANALDTNTTVSTDLLAWIEIRDGTTNRVYWFDDTTNADTRRVDAVGAGSNQAPFVLQYLAHVINSDLTGLVTAQAIESAEKTRASIVFESKRLLPSATISIRAYPVTAWSPQPDNDSDALTLDVEERLNRICWSKQSLPEAVPITQYLDLGSEKAPVLKMLSTRDAMFIFKADGVWRLVCSGPNDIRVDQFDPTLVLLNPNAIDRMRNAIYLWSNRGFAELTDSGVIEIGGPISDQVSEIEHGALTSKYEDGIVAACHETGEYVLFTVPDAYNDGSANYLFRYSTRTGTWTRWDFLDIALDVASAVVDPAVDLMVLGGAISSTGVARRELYQSKYDRSHSVTIDTVVGSTITIAGGSGWTPEVGDRITRSGVHGFVSSVDSATVFDVRSNSTLATGAATAYEGYSCKVRWTAKSEEGPNLMKHWQRSSLHFDTLDLVSALTLRFLTPQITTEAEVSVVRSTITESEAGPAVDLSFLPSRNHSVGSRLEVEVEINQATSEFKLSGLSLEYTPFTTRVSR